MLAFVGMDPRTGIARYSEDFLFMWDGIDLITAILALFAVPEMIALSVKGGSSWPEYFMKALPQGVLSVLLPWFGSLFEKGRFVPPSAERFCAGPVCPNRRTKPQAIAML